jgi:transposase
MTRNHIGVDLSQAMLDIVDPLRGEARVANQPGPIDRWLAGLGPEDVLVFEATSGCDRALIAALSARGQDFARLNPLQAWHFAQSLNLAKTDRVDARMLARLGAERRPEPTPAADPAREELRQLSQRRDQLKRMETQERNRLSACRLPLVARDIRAELANLARRLRKIEQAIADQVGRHPPLAAAIGLLRTIPGLGPVTAVELVAHLPELGQTDRRGVASLAGLAPKARDSGKYRGKRFLGEGRRHVRKALYMAALSGLRHDGFLADFVRRMRARGKPGKVIVMAVARRLLTIANAVLRDGAPFRRQRPAAG